MRGRGYDFEGCAIEFGDEPEQYFSKIVCERLAPARQCGAGVLRIADVRKLKNA